MNQYVNSNAVANHTKSDNVNSDIRAISALQQQADFLDERVTNLEEVIKLIHKTLEDIHLALQETEKTVGGVTGYLGIGVGKEK